MAWSRRMPNDLVRAEDVVASHRHAGRGDPWRRTSSDKIKQGHLRGGCALIVRSLRGDALEQVSFDQLGGGGVAKVNRRHCEGSRSRANCAERVEGGHVPSDEQTI